MSFCSVQFSGESIEKASSMNVILPDGPGPFGVLYLLHGLSDDHSIWQRRTSLERYVAELPLIVVMPDGHRSFYCNDPRPGGCAYEDHMVADVVGFVDRTFRTVPEARARAIGGLSMGGYGSMMLALRHPDVFGVVGAHSSAFEFAHVSLPEQDEINDFAAALPADKYDCFALAEGLAGSDSLPALRFDCGTEDFLLEANRNFHAHLEKLEIAHEYAEHPGEHNWDHWDLHVRETLAFVMEHLRT
ncbi:hypothetical protein LCGC14_1774710 [marine sediment metagenome]|uniref:Esterase n=1 Tax=marine sediment metagenome TaxID=412755 RepID=A0A0F9JWX3_9ZZZZ